MRLVPAILVLVSFSACKRHLKPPADPPAVADAAPIHAAPAADTTLADVAPAPAPPAGLRGRVAEKIDVAQYSYLRIEAPGGDTWAAVPKCAVKVGDTVAIADAVWMENFQSKSLGRSWDRIAFGTLDGDAGAETSRDVSNPSRSAGMFSDAARAAPSALPSGHAQNAALPSGHPPPAAPQDLGDLSVAKAAGPRGRTIADIYGQRAQLEERSVAVRGKVVKATNDVMGKNWLHLRDGTGSGATADLTIASADTAKVGDTVLFVGTVRLNRDLGAGYHYDVIVEDAKLQGN